MNDESKIAQSSWTSLSESKLDAFSTTAAVGVSNATEYPDVQPEALELTNASNSYHIAFSRHKQFGGTDNREVKDAAKARLYQAHEALAVKLEATANGNTEYITRLGYRLDRKGGRPSTAKVPAPILKKVESKSVRGRVQIILKAKNPREIKGIIGRFSLDNGKTWTNGIHVYDLNFTLNDQPSGAGILYQFYFQATGKRKSDWSEFIYIDVY